jgi:chloramphenicol O-acetyltransferase type A
MRTIDKLNWSRGKHFEFFNTFNHPHFNLCANVDLTKFHPYVKEHGYSFTAAIIYVISRAANTIPEFRQRLRGDEIIEHEIVSPSVTILVEHDLFSFCTIDFTLDFNIFAERAVSMMARVRGDPTLKDPPGRDDLLFMTAIPWVSFTSFMHPMRLHPTDSFPRFAWGKYFEQAGKVMMPLSVQGHHALMDGIHIGRYYEIIEDYLQQPAVTLGSW